MDEKMAILKEKGLKRRVLNLSGLYQNEQRISTESPGVGNYNPR